jgi:selenocysteine-specific elongation factor
LFAPTSVVDCALEILASSKPLKNGAPVHFHAATAEVLGEIRGLDNASVLKPGSRTFARIVLREPLLLLPGDRFIVRKFSPVVTIGGGEVLDCDPPRRLARRALFRRAESLASASLAHRIALILSEAPQGLPVSALVARTGLQRAALLSALPKSVYQFEGWLVHQERATALTTGWRKQLGEFHRANPLLAGWGKEVLRSRDLPDAPPAVFNALLSMEKQIVSTGEFVRLASHKIAFQEGEREAVLRIESAFEEAGLQVPALPDVLRSCGVDPARARTLLQILLRDRRLVRVSDDLIFHAEAIGRLREILAGRKGQRFSVTDFKDWTGVSRKYAIPLLEWMDRERLTRRDGDTRVLL